MPLVYVQRFSTLPIFEIGTQYIESGSTLTLGNPTYVDMSSPDFDAAGIYVIFSIVGGTFTTPETQVQYIEVIGVPSGRSVVQQGVYDAYWDAATNTVRVQLS